MKLVVCCLLALAIAVSARPVPLTHSRELQGGCLSIAELAQAAGLTTLLTAIGAADPAIAALLTDKSTKATVFAPSNAAFAAVPNLGAVVANQTLLTNILKYHVIAGSAIRSRHLPLFTTVDTALGGSAGRLSIFRFRLLNYIRLFTSSGGTSRVIAPDNMACNAVVHVVNQVLIPRI